VRPARTETPATATEAIVSISTIVPFALLAVIAVHLTLRSPAAGDEGRQACIALLFLIAARLLIALEIRLRLLMRLVLRLMLRLLRLLMLRPLLHMLTGLLLSALKIRLLLRLLIAVHIIPVVVIFVAASFHVRTLERLVLLVRILLNELRLRRHDHTEVVLGVLQVTLGGDRIAR